MDRFIVVNGKVVEKDEINLSFLIHENYNKFTTKIWYGFGGIPLLHENNERIKSELIVQNIPVPDVLKNESELFRVTKRMLNKNKFYRSGYVLIHLFWNEESVNSVFTSTAFSTFDFPFKAEGLLTGFSPSLKKITPFSDFVSFHSPFWSIAKAELEESQIGNQILLNENNQVCESVGSSIYLVSNGKIVTPSLQTGCYNGILRNILLEIATDLKYKVVESVSISKKETLEMKEIFIANEAEGIRWILGIEDKRFIHQVSDEIWENLNEWLKTKVH